MKKQVTFQMIADELGVSKGLVSLALRNKYGVSEKMRSQIVLKAVEMGYVFHTQPRKLRRVTLLIKNMGVLNEEFWRQCICGIEQECAKRNLLFNIIGWMRLENEDDITVQLLSEKSEGVIILNQCRQKIVENLGKLDIPMVFVDMVNPLSFSADSVMANNFNAGMQATQYLLQKGHREIVLLGNVEYSYSFLQRYYGCIKYIKRATRDGEDVHCHCIIDCEKSNLVDGVYQNDESDLCNETELERFLSKERNGFTGIVCFNDSILRRVLAVIEKNGLRVPEDISVVSIDNTEFAARKEITSVDIPKGELGTQAVRILVDRMENLRNTSINCELDVSLTERKSVKEVHCEKE